MGLFYFNYNLSLPRTLKPSIKEREETYMKKNKVLLTTTLLISLGLAACSTQGTTTQAQTTQTQTTTTTAAATTATTTYFEASDLTATHDESTATKISLQGTTATASGEGVTVNGSTVEITKAGTYIVEGTATQAQIKVAAGAEDEVHVVFKNATIKNTEAPFVVTSAKKVTVTLAEGTTNELADESSSTVKGALYAESNLIINGKGSLTVTGNASNAINATGGLKIVDATITATAQNDAITASDYIYATGATLNVTATEDGINANNEKDVLLGNVYLTNTKVTSAAGDDGVRASGTLIVDTGADVTVQKSDEGFEARVIQILDGTVSVTSSDDGLVVKSWTWDLDSTDGIQNADQAEDVKVIIDGGTITVDAEGDGIDSNGDLQINGGTLVVNGPTQGGNGALDYDNTGLLNGGTILFVDTGDMAMGFDSSSNQAYLMGAISGEAGTTVEVLDASGNTVISLDTTKTFSYVLVSSEKIVEGETYTIKVGSQTISVTASKEAAKSSGPGQGGPGGGPGH